MISRRRIDKSCRHRHRLDRSVFIDVVRRGQEDNWSLLFDAVAIAHRRPDNAPTTKFRPRGSHVLSGFLEGIVGLLVPGLRRRRSFGEFLQFIMRGHALARPAVRRHQLWFVRPFWRDCCHNKQIIDHATPVVKRVDERLTILLKNTG